MSLLQQSQKKKQKSSGFTLVEVMITMVLITMMCLSIFAGLHQITRSMAAVGLRSEAYHLLQAKAEELLSTDYANFTASAADETIAGAFKTSFVQSSPTGPNAVPQFKVLPTDGAGRINYKRRVLDVTGATGTTNGRTLKVEVEWEPKWTDRASKQTISTLLHRSP